MRFFDIMTQLDAHLPHRVELSADWTQGRATFGGLVAALVYQGMRQQVPLERAVRSLSVSFVGPVSADDELSLEASVLREGRSVTQVEGRAYQHGQAMAVIQGSFGAPRESSVSVPPEPVPRAPAPDDCRELPFMKGMSPEFTRHFAYRWAFGDLPFSGSKSREMGGWVRFREEQSATTEAHLLALVDAWPPAVLPMLQRPAPASSLSWTIEFVQPVPAGAAEDWWLYQALVDHAANGYGHTQARLWNARGELVALSRQTVTIFA